MQIAAIFLLGGQGGTAHSPTVHPLVVAAEVIQEHAAACLLDRTVETAAPLEAAWHVVLPFTS